MPLIVVYVPHVHFTPFQTPSSNVLSIGVNYTDPENDLTFQFPLINVIKQQNRWKKCLSILRLYSKVFPRALSVF